MRVLSIGNRYPPWSTGGYEVTWAAAMRFMQTQRHQVRVLTTTPDPSDHSQADPPAEVHRELRWYWRENRFPSIGVVGSLGLERHNATVFSHHVREFTPDVVMWWGMGGMSLSLLAQARRMGLAQMAAVGDEWVAYGPSVDAWTKRTRRLPGPAAAPIGRLTGIPARLDLERVDRWAFNSRYTLQSARRTGWRLPQAVVVHPGVNQEKFAPREPDQWCWRLLYCGRIDPRKGIATAIEALPLLPETARLRIHGQGDARHEEELRLLTKRLAVEQRVAFTGGTYEEVPDVYAGADAVLFPVRWREPWGLVPLEAMAIGRPVVASRAQGGPAEYLKDQDNCVQFDEGPAGLASSLQKLAHDPQVRDRVIAGGRATAARYTEQDFHAGLLSELEQAVSGALSRR